MGDIKRIRKKYTTPMHPWNKERIDAERGYKRTFALTNKKELWKAESILKSFKDQIKSFPSMDPEQAEKQRKQLRAKLKKYGLADENTILADVLGYDTEVILERRLQTLVFKKGLSRTAKQARQFITHEHILVNGRVVNAPGYLVPVSEEAHISFKTTSKLGNEDHPERRQEEVPQQKKKVVEKKQEEQPELVELSEEDKNLE